MVQNPVLKGNKREVFFNKNGPCHIVIWWIILLIEPFTHRFRPVKLLFYRYCCNGGM
jgi:hypothetical protein